MSRRRTGIVSRLFAFLIATLANVTVGGRHGMAPSGARPGAAPVLSKHWPLMVTVRAAFVAAVVAATVALASNYSPVEAAVATFMI